jgi:dUTP pyrophosphatase
MSKSKLKLGIKKIYGGVDLPKFGTEGAAAFDLSYQPGERSKYGVYRPANSYVERDLNQNGGLSIMPGERALVPTSLIFDIPEGYHLKVYTRSSTGIKKGLILCNSVGVIDSDYTGEVSLLLHNITDVQIMLDIGTRLCQAMLVKNEEYVLEEVAEVSEKKSSRAAGNEGGLGSTGEK